MSSRGKIVAIAIITVLTLDVLFITGYVTHAQPPLPQVPAWKAEPYGPRVDTYLWKVIPNRESRYAAFEAGEVDFVVVDPPDVERIRTNKPDAFFVLTQGYTIVPLQFNVRRYPFSELAVRQAFAHIIDREGFVIPEILKGFGLPIYSVVLPLYGDWYNPNAKTYDFSLQKADQVLNAAGFVRGPDGFRVDPKTGQPLRTIELITVSEQLNPNYFKTGQHIIKQAEKIGLKVTHTSVTNTVYTQRIPNQDFDMYFNGWSLAIYPTFMATFWHTRTDVKLGTNRYGVRDPLVDELADKFIQAPTEKEAKEQLWKLQDRIHEIVPWVPVYQPIAITAYSGKVRGLVYTKLKGQTYPLGTSFLNDLNVHLADSDFGGTYRGVSAAEFANLNPMYYLFVNEDDVLSQIYEQLVGLNPDDPYGARFPRLASSWKSEVFKEGAQDRTRLTMTVIQNATWHDGEPFTAEDIAWTIKVPGLQWKTRRQFNDITALMTNLLTVDTPDKYTVVLTINGTSWNYLIQLLGLRIVPKQIWGSMTKDQAQSTDPSVKPHPTKSGFTMLIGTGPYILREHIPGNSVALQWFPAYFKRHPDKNFLFDIQFDNQKLLLSIKVTDYLKKTVTDAAVAVTVATTEGRVVKETRAIHTGSGTYAADVSPLDPGTYKARVKAEKDLNPGVLSKVSEYTLTVPSPLVAYLPYAAAIVAVLIVAALVLRMRGRKTRAGPSPSTA